MKTNEKIRHLRESHQWTQEDMANRLSMSTQGYAKIERGDTRLNLDRLGQITEVFGIDIMELLSYGEESAIQFNNISNNESVSHTFFSAGQASDNELQKLHLIISHQTETIESLKRENKLLMEMNELLKQQRECLTD
ncbi:helix-turn-helix domain-containing protein [Avibacterium avium]|uniref:helix-turn-helix domain-containing protein n=1 Tax=Avibacterium avium TaxID=751 RepID=UPI003BF89D7A